MSEKINKAKVNVMRFEHAGITSWHIEVIAFRTIALALFARIATLCGLRTDCVPSVRDAVPLYRDIPVPDTHVSFTVKGTLASISDAIAHYEQHDDPATTVELVNEYYSDGEMQETLCKELESDVHTTIERHLIAWPDEHVDAVRDLRINLHREVHECVQGAFRRMRWGI